MKRELVMAAAFVAVSAQMLKGFGPQCRQDRLLEAKLRSYVAEFNRAEVEDVTNAVPNSVSADFLAANVPLFECPDQDIERTYYFRWWTYRKHLRKDEEGWVVSEFLHNVGHAGKNNAISCPLGHHLMEGRWLRDRRFLDDYTRYWFKPDRRLHGKGSYVNWIARAILKREEVTGDTAVADSLLDGLVRNYEAWEKGWEARPWPADGKYKMGLKADGLFHDVDDREGTELTLSGNGARPHVNGIMSGEAKAIAKIAARCGRQDLAAAFEERAERLAENVRNKLWNSQKGFFTVLKDDGSQSEICEIHGYTPWYVGMPLDDRFAVAWRYFADSKSGFKAPWGLTFPVQSAPGFRISYEGHACQWNGPTWPFATSIALTALADSLHAGLKLPVGKDEWFEALRTYARSQTLKLPDGSRIPWIDEVQDPYTGDWIAYKRWKRTSCRTYNHSTFCDIVISGLVGFQVKADGTCEAKPLVPDSWDWFRLEKVPVRGKLVTVSFDRDGTRYGEGKGLKITER